MKGRLLANVIKQDCELVNERGEPIEYLHMERRNADGGKTLVLSSKPIAAMTKDTFDSLYEVENVEGDKVYLDVVNNVEYGKSANLRKIKPEHVPTANECLVISNMFADITGDIIDVYEKEWLKPAIVSHITELTKDDTVYKINKKKVELFVDRLYRMANKENK